jgi:hypothetical protein
MAKFDSFVYLKDYLLTGLKSPEKKNFKANYSPLLDNDSNNTVASLTKPAIATKAYSSKYYFLSASK